MLKETASTKNIKYESNESASSKEKIEERENEDLNLKRSRFIVKSRITSRNANTLFLLLRIFLEIVVVVMKWTIMFLLFGSSSGFTQQKFAIEPQDQVRSFFYV